MATTLDRVPAHLRRFVVQQDYAAYTAIDQAVWRFVLLQMFDRLRHSAHPAYSRGLTQTGMSVERIPRIAEMDDCLSQYGWGAVCVDGFIPPRAFQEFQALGILPIAADMRRHENLAYTPAPDIIHEAAGHAPILPDPEYAAFLKRISACGIQAFASRRDTELFQAVRRLSIVKELRDADPAAVRAASEALAALVARPAPSSEATRLARLYWWTVEYGLVGSPEDYKLYGAGLLSSLAESHFCHDARVRKLVLTKDAVHCDYDITQPQPQLFVARDFAHLTEVLDEVCADCAFRVGGLRGLDLARDADELATIELDNGMQLIGTLVAWTGDGERPVLLQLDGECALARASTILEAGAGPHGRAVYPNGFAVALDPGNKPRAPFGKGAERWRALAGEGAEVALELPAGLRATGRAVDVFGGHGEDPVAVVLEHARVERAGEALEGLADCTLVLLAGDRVRSVRAGASDASYWPAQRCSNSMVPRAEAESAAQRELRSLFEQEARIPRQHGALSDVAAVHERLAAYPDEWLLRWNLLARLTQLDVDPARRAALAEELWQLELKLERRHPIATGLAYLGQLDRRA